MKEGIKESPVEEWVQMFGTLYATNESIPI